MEFLKDTRIEDRLSDAVATKILETFGIKIVKRIGFQGKSDLEP